MIKKLRNLKLNDFLRNHILVNLKVNEDSSYALYFDCTLDIKQNKYHKTVKLIELDGLQITQPTLPFEPDDFIIDHRGIIFKIVETGSTIFYLYNHIDKKIKKLSTIPFEVEIFAFLGTKIYFTAIVKDQNADKEIKCSQSWPFYIEGRETINDEVTGLYRSDYSGKNITLITSLSMDIDQVDCDFRNNRIMFSALKKKKHNSTSSVIYMYDIQKKIIKLIHNKNFRISNIKSMTENLVLFIGIDLDKYSRNDNQQIYKINLITGYSEILGDFQDKSNENPALVTDSFFSTSLPIQKFGDKFYFKKVERDRDMLYKIDMDGSCETIETGIKSIGGFSVIEKGIVILGLKSMKLSEVYFFNNDRTKQVSYHNKWLDKISLSKAEKITFQVVEESIDGYVFPPVVLQKDKKYPAVLMIHGGPKLIYSDIFTHDMQILCANGYYVFCANPIGSDGKGNGFSNIRGKFAHLPYKQLISFTDVVLKKYPDIDACRLGVMGGSYGGYMTNYIITRTSRFKAAISERSISNLMTFFTSSDIGYQFGFEYLGNISPWMDPLATMEVSPIYKVHKATTPTLFIHGKNDYRCHYTESLNMFNALSYFGIDAKLCLFDDENHGLVVRGRPKSKMRRYEEIISWFDRFLKVGDCL